MRPSFPTDSTQAMGDTVRFPDLADLAARLHFSTREGRIRLGGERMLLVQARAFGALRREVIASVGIDAARRLFTRMGYQAGAHDAGLARKVRSTASFKDLFVAGPQLHGLLGNGSATTVRLEFDLERGSHYGEFVWTGEPEDEEHSRHFPSSAEPMCWMQIGYACGFGTELMGRPVLYREVECQSMGQAACRIVGKPVEEWGDEAAQDMRFLGVDMPAGGHLAGVATPVVGGTLPGAGLDPAFTCGDDAVGRSPSFQAACQMVVKVAPTLAKVLFTGESGVGKEVFARMLHRLSARACKAFVALNCAAMPDALVESELFGVDRGAFTGADHSRPGRFERADGGTLFLDEIGTLSLTAQGKLLRALQEGEVERVGGNRARQLDVRVVAATNVDLREAVKAGRFREDLFHRLNVFPIRIPPLRERREDIPLLMEHFLAQFSRRHGRRPAGFTPRAIDAMLSYDWPGNIRELENVVERGVVLCTEGRLVEVQHLFTNGEQFGECPLRVGPEGRLAPIAHDREADVTRRATELLLGQGDVSDGVSLEEIETILLKNAVARANGNVSAAARLLGITRPQMVYRLKGLGHGVPAADQPATTRTLS